MFFKKNNPGCPCCIEGIPCPDCNCRSSRPALVGSGDWKQSPDCLPALHGYAQIQYVVCITQAFTPCGGSSAPVVAPPAVGTKIYIESERGCAATNTCCRYLNRDVAAGYPGLRCRLFMPTCAATGNFEIDIYYPHTSGVWDFYFHAELPPFGSVGGLNLFKCDQCTTISNQVVSSDCGGQGKGDFNSFLYKTTAYGGQIKIGPCRSGP